MDLFVFSGKVTFSRLAGEDREQWLTCNIAVRGGQCGTSLPDSGDIFTAVLPGGGPTGAATIAGAAGGGATGSGCACCTSFGFGAGAGSASTTGAGFFLRFGAASWTGAGSGAGFGGS